MSTLIIYASKHGATEKVVSRLKEKIGGNIQSFNVKKESIPPLESYEAVILGGSIYVGKVQKELTEYINGHLNELLTKRVGIFLCAGHPDEQQLAKELRESFPEALSNHALVKEIVGYEFDFSKMNMLEKFAVKKIQGIKESQFALSEEKIDRFVEKLQL